MTAIGDPFALAKIVLAINEDVRNSRNSDVAALAASLSRDLPSLSAALVHKLVANTVSALGGTAA